MTVALKEMIETSLTTLGGAAYLVEQGKKNPVAYLHLVGKLLPKEIRADIGQSLAQLLAESRGLRLPAPPMRDVVATVKPDAPLDVQSAQVLVQAPTAPSEAGVAPCQGRETQGQGPTPAPLAPAASPAPQGDHASAMGEGGGAPPARGLTGGRSIPTPSPILAPKPELSKS
jgi:hypothetical protein